MCSVIHIGFGHFVTGQLMKTSRADHNKSTQLFDSPPVFTELMLIASYWRLDMIFNRTFRYWPLAILLVVKNVITLKKVDKMADCFKPVYTCSLYLPFFCFIRWTIQATRGPEEHSSWIVLFSSLLGLHGAGWEGVPVDECTYRAVSVSFQSRTRTWMA